MGSKLVAVGLLVVVAVSRCHAVSLLDSIAGMGCERRAATLEAVQSNAQAWVRNAQDKFARAEANPSTNQWQRTGQRLLGFSAKLVGTVMKAHHVALNCTAPTTHASAATNYGTSRQALLDELSGVSTLIQTGVGGNRLVYVVRDERYEYRSKMCKMLLIPAFVVALVGSFLTETRSEELQKPIDFVGSNIEDRVSHFFGVYERKGWARFTILGSFGLGYLCLWGSFVFLLRALSYITLFEHEERLSSNALLATAAVGPLVVCYLGPSVAVGNLPAFPSGSSVPTGCFKPVAMDTGTFNLNSQEPSSPSFVFEFPRDMALPSTAEDGYFATFAFWSQPPSEWTHPYVAINTPGTTATFQTQDPFRFQQPSWETTYNGFDTRESGCNVNIAGEFAAATGCLGSGNLEQPAVVPFNKGPIPNGVGVVLKYNFLNDPAGAKAACRQQLPLRIVVRAPDTNTRRVYFVFRPGCSKFFSPRDLGAWDWVPPEVEV